jgi:hypothetical protein
MPRCGSGTSEGDPQTVASRAGQIPSWLLLVIDHVGRHTSGAHVYGASRYLLDTRGLILTGWPHPRQLHASAEQIPLAEAAFDLVISEYDASIRCDPCSWVPGAARVLRPGAADLPGQLCPDRPHLTGPGRPAGHRNAAAALLRHAPRKWLCEEVRKAANHPDPEA